ncbi:hypothetical protein BASA50_009413 [Batrachochytrium salamandrivorans]|uniref:NupC family nucleoside transporter n=1 Tax=Batrachochytrium salamandrivorans TaxID=1357716 RepID=A0ABQ8F1K7_9FUNG|nr:hypothetical protein BASA62_007565 [Batrachochytrium salamandrivorans]KAH6581539.1 hypothetical protein BASA60_002371 [Batrachochytrium salamandrivorans]KAH6590438.1 hypothetical protein BASA50_009413 [Batrachochytrium salamandrivorans]KAH6594120.1 hypothetical protein BASA61_004109 [Batrachochytrium salamandrivorans]KAH9273229.1 hypothetical protein BASA83_004518 [Batrachochytrium salamandrivorans]
MNSAQHEIEVLHSDTKVATPVTLTKPLFMKRTTRELLIDLAIFSVISAYIIALWILGRGKDGFEIYTLAYVFVSLRLLARHVSVSQLIYAPLGKAVDTISKPFERVPGIVKSFAFLAFTLILIVVISLTNPVSGDNTLLARLQSYAGILVTIFAMWATSTNRKAVPWHTVASGMFMQYLIALFVLRTTVGFNIFKYISVKIAKFLDYSAFGLEFLITPDYNHTLFAASVFPAIIFFCSFVSIVYYFGGMQYIIGKMGWFMMYVMDVSGAEAVVAAASPFIGQGENALLVRPFVEHMTNSELHAIMTAGFSTISGSVLLFYISITGNGAAILTSCVMSIPASLLLSKMRYPELDVPLTKGSIHVVDHGEKEANFLHAAGNGAGTGIQLVLLIGATLIAIVALFTCANDIYGNLFAILGIYNQVHPQHADGSFDEVTIQFSLSYIFYPIAWLIGIPGHQARDAGEVMATKMVVNEFVAYLALGKTESIPRGSRAFTLMTFALCGFANISSIGIQLGCLGAIAPTRKGDLAKLVVSAMLVGTTATFLSAAVAGTLI